MATPIGGCTPYQRLATQTEQNRWSSPELRALGRIGTPEATAAAETYLKGITNDDTFFNQAGSYLRETKSPVVMQLLRDRFRANPGSRHMWSVVRGLSAMGTPEATAILQEVATSSTVTGIRSQATRFIEERSKIEESITATER